MDFVNKYWSFVSPDHRTRELLQSNDCKYVFECKVLLGTFEADYSNLNRSL